MFGYEKERIYVTFLTQLFENILRKMKNVITVKSFSKKHFLTFAKYIYDSNH